MATKDPLHQSDGTMNEPPSFIRLRDRLKLQKSYSIVPYPNGMGVRVGPGNIKHARGSSRERYIAGTALYPERGIAKGGSSKGQRKWMVEFKYENQKGLISRFGELFAESAY